VRTADDHAHHEPRDGARLLDAPDDGIGLQRVGHLARSLRPKLGLHLLEQLVEIKAGWLV
jgi:hypothetical protein